MESSLDFQSMILKLQHFWAEQGCMIWQPYYTQVGAGTNNPATILRVLGPEPWHVAYVEPSVRPDDGRYGENPNRLQQHYQFQVILKPDPGNPQELYLKSLEAIGIDPRRHDIRFVEDNWESPALGAWGLGWEVWLDGQEITQFTYFQQAGGFTLDPVSVEITYGLERIAMPLQRVRNFKDIRWSPGIHYGDINLMGEQEHSKYYFEAAGVDNMRQMYDLYEKETERALEAGLVLPALDYILKCSHTFNVLDTRGAIGVTERQAYFSRMRTLTHRVSESYLEQRQRQEYPFLDEKSGPSATPPAFSSRVAVPAISAAKRPFLLEVGTEELPATDFQALYDQLLERIPALLDDLRLAHGEVSILGTPRRLVAYVKDLAPRQEDRETLVKGPPAARAFDAMGLPTAAAEGFARSRGIDVKALEVREIDGGRYAAALVKEVGKPAVEVLSNALPTLLAGLKVDKSMRWNASNTAFSRPIRWLLALLGDVVIPFDYAGLTSANTTRGLRFMEPHEAAISSPDEYFKFLSNQGIIINPIERRRVIAEQVEKITLESGGAYQADDKLLDEVMHLVEAPTSLRGQFNAAHLKLPVAVLVSVMKKHQRYFPIYNARGQLLPYFITVRNGDNQHLDVVADGNEQVIGARFADAEFFISQDVRHPLADYLPRLSTLMFQSKLGSMGDKGKRITTLVEKLAPLLAIEGEEFQVAHRSAELCKADLVTHMVIEMTSLQGVMGQYYSRLSGEPEAVSQAIFEHYLPRSSGDILPTSRAALAVGIADRLDSLAGLFAAGLAPSGTRDPFALRRAALGLVQALAGWNVDFDLRQGLALASQGLPLELSNELSNACFDFITGRLRAWLVEQDYRYDIVDAVMSAQMHNPAGVARGVKELSEWVARRDWNTILPAYARCVRITRDQTERFTVNPTHFSDDSEAVLLQDLLKAEAVERHPSSVNDFFAVFLPLIPSINTFFEKVLVMSEVPVERTNRLGMLQRIAMLASTAADFSKLEGF